MKKTAKKVAIKKKASARKPKPDASQNALSVVEKAIGGKLASASGSASRR